MKKLLLLTIFLTIMSTACISCIKSSDAVYTSNNFVSTDVNDKSEIGTTISSKSSSTSATAVFSNSLLSTDSLAYKSGEAITFTVTYTDADNVAPVYVRLLIYEADNVTAGVYQITNNQVDPGDTDYTDGKDYYYTTTEGSSRLTQIGVHRFYYTADDAGEYIQYPASGYSHIEVVYHAPVLTAGTATPDNVPLNSGTFITFSVTYTQEDNIAPSYIRLLIFENDNVTAGVYQITNNQVDPEDTDYTDGKDYYFTTNEGSGRLTEEGVHRYYFYTTIDDNVNSYVQLPSSDYYYVEITPAVAEFPSQIVATLFLPMFIGTIVVLTKKRQ